MEPHAYVFTMVGRCARCQELEAAHLVMLPKPDPLTECTVDHASINTAWGITDGGCVWRRCPMCGVQVEGAMRTGVVEGPAYGPGRGDLTPRQKDHLRGWLGYMAHFGQEH